MKMKIIIAVSLIVVALLSVGGFYYITTKDDTKEVEEKKEVIIEEEIIPEKVDIIDLESNTRSIAVMINNLNAARPYQSGLQDAYIVYECIVEGGITRMMAVFKDKNVSRIGTVRSARPYYLDYALENDAIYVHFGWSYHAKDDMSVLGVNNINFLYDSGAWRENLPVAREHTAFTSTDNILSTVSKKGYRTTTTQKTLLNYNVEDVNLSVYDNAVVANNISIPYSYYMTSSYAYDAENKYYKRYANGVAHTDYVTKEQFHFKNIIVINVTNYTLSGAYQGLKNVGTGTGYYITNGYAVPITYEKTARASQTVYKLLDGTELNVSDGNTFIQIQPTNQTTTIS